MTRYTSEKFTDVEVRHVTWLRGNEHRNDTHVVKLTGHTEDGRRVPFIEVLEDYERPYWITKKYYRDHTDKKEWEHIDKLNEFTATDSRLTTAIKTKLGIYSPNPDKVANNPYIYGTNITASSIIHQQYRVAQVKDTPWTTCYYDLETDLVDDTILMGSICFNSHVLSVVRNVFMKGIKDPVKKIEQVIRDKYPGNRDEIDIEIVMVDTEMDVLRTLFKRIHEWKPDWLAIWNIMFDIRVTMEACKRAKVNPADLFTDPELPDTLKNFQLKQGPTQKITSTDKVTPIRPSEQWHSVIIAASFFVVDAMCVYRRLRLAKPVLPGGMGLDSVLDHELSISKMKFEESDGYVGVDWHIFMQKNYPAEYVVYNMWDTVSIELLDKKTNDLSTTLASFAVDTEIGHYARATKLITDVLHFYLQTDHNMVLGSPARIAENDPLLLGLNDWIVTAPAHLLLDTGLSCVRETPLAPTNIRAHVFDSDCVSSYPMDLTALNVSKDTCRTEILTVRGVEKEVMKQQNMGALAAGVNSMDYCCTMMHFPTAVELLTKWYISKK